jgi:hypothetical protein
MRGYGGTKAPATIDEYVARDAIPRLRTKFTSSLSGAAVPWDTI